MGRAALKLSALKDLDLGKVDLAFAREIEAAVKDCANRPGEKGARRVVLALDIKPEELTQGGQLESVTVGFDIKTAMPAKKSKAYPMMVDAQNRLIFNTEASGLDEPRQKTLDEAIEE